MVFRIKVQPEGLEPSQKKQNKSIIEYKCMVFRIKVQPEGLEPSTNELD